MKGTFHHWGLLAALGAIEDDPDHEIVGEILEAVVGSGGHEEKVAGRKWVALAPIAESSTSLHHDVYLVFGVRGLGLASPRRIHLDTEGAVMRAVFPLR